MNKELTDLIKNGTFKVLPDLPKGEKAINYRWVLSLKADKDGMITGPKARLVAKRFKQREGANHHQTSEPTPAVTSTKIAFTVALYLGVDAHHFDVKRAPAQAMLDCKVIVKLPG